MIYIKTTTGKRVQQLGSSVYEHRAGAQSTYIGFYPHLIETAHIKVIINI